MPRRPLTRTLAALLCALVALAPFPALAQDDAVQRYLTAASRLYENLEYERALEQLKRAKSISSRTVDDDVAIALYEGIILADLGKKEESIAAFKEGLYLKPDAKLPVKVSPKVVSDFEGVRIEVKKELAPILAKQQAEKLRKEEEARKAEAEARARADAEARAREQAEERAKPRPSDGPVEEKQKTLNVQGDPTKQSPAYVPGAEQRMARGAPVTPLVLGGIGLAAAGASAYFGLQSRSQVSAARDAQFQDDTVRSLRQAESSALIANIAFGVAGAAAIAAIITAVTSGGDEMPPPRRTEVEGAGAGSGE